MRLTLLTVLMLVARAALALDRTSDLGSGWRVSAGYLHQDYREYNSGLNPSLTAPVVDQEQGDIPELGLDLWRTVGGFYGELELHYVHGKDHYAGYACGASSCVPSTTSTTNSILTSSFELGPDFGNDAWRLVPYVTLGNWAWDREIADTPTAAGGSELYRFSYYGIGVLGQFLSEDGAIWSVRAMAGRTLGPALDVNINGNDTQLDLGEQPLVRAAAGVDLPLAGAWRLMTSVGYMRFRFGASPVYAVGNILVQEPASLTQQWTYDVGFGRHF